MRLERRAARASIAISREGCSLSTIPFTISPVSIPVIPITPGLTAATGRTAFSISTGSVPLRWRVTRILEITFGPSASGVMFQLPSPITRMQSSLFGFARERICSARSLTFFPALSAITSISLFFLATSSVCVPMEPVEPKTDIFFIISLPQYANIIS